MEVYGSSVCFFTFNYQVFYSFIKIGFRRCILLLDGLLYSEVLHNVFYRFLCRRRRPESLLSQNVIDTKERNSLSFLLTTDYIL